MRLSRLKVFIKDADLSNQKAPRIKAILSEIRHDFGMVSLEPPRRMRSIEAEAYLKSLPGVQAIRGVIGCLWLADHTSHFFKDG
jgi:endonuclease III